MPASLPRHPGNSWNVVAVGKWVGDTPDKRSQFPGHPAGIKGMSARLGAYWEIPPAMVLSLDGPLSPQRDW